MKLYVHDDFGRIVGIVSYNDILDHGNSPYHRGITRLHSGEYVLIDSDGVEYKACTVSDYVAFQAILEADCEDLLDDPKFADLKRFWDDLATEL